MDTPPPYVEPADETGHMLDVSDEPNTLDMRTLETIESAVVWEMGEDVSEHKDHQIAFIRDLVTKNQAGNFNSNPRDATDASLQGGFQAARGEAD